MQQSNRSNERRSFVNEQDRLEIATSFLDELEAKARHHTMADRVEDPSLENAYLIQDSFVDIMLSRGEQVVAWKVALTSKAMQEFCGVNHPLSGAVFGSRVQKSPGQVVLSEHRHLGLECEIAVQLATDLDPTTTHTKETVRDAVDACYPSFELIEDRDADYDQLNPFDSVSENAWNAGVVLGSPFTNWQDLDLVNTPTVLEVNGEVLGSGKTGDALGHPFEAVAWLANHLNDRGRTIRAGEFVMTGSTVITYFPQTADRVKFSVGEHGSAELACL